MPSGCVVHLAAVGTCCVTAMGCEHALPVLIAMMVQLFLFFFSSFHSDTRKWSSEPEAALDAGAQQAIHTHQSTKSTHEHLLCLQLAY